ncbi:PPA1309 family protein [Sanguibacter antarcticus]|uniref:Uncharacterized protein n=1 Tax=Sanguibacter antarcticus TaxID=372484 RepID=A0A2A9E475_9MICO|nr:PPA1309 family protein [Sanguibacter antarcticus]PFG33847.1 hypothetical protein ATL42_1741 [Sanguibacter antarcticus]
MTSPVAPSLTENQRALADAVVDVERHVAATGWDAPPRVFALVSTQAALLAEPELAKQLPAATVQAALDDPSHLTSVEQDELPATEALEELLASITWPEAVIGTAVVIERIVLPPSAETEIPDDPAAALVYLSSHPDRQDVRMAVGVLRDGVSWCAVRTRMNDSDNDVAVGADLVPGLIEGLLSTFE